VFSFFCGVIIAGPRDSRLRHKNYLAGRLSRQWPLQWWKTSSHLRASYFFRSRDQRQSVAPGSGGGNLVLPSEQFCHAPRAKPGPPFLRLLRDWSTWKPRKYFVPGPIAREVPGRNGRHAFRECDRRELRRVPNHIAKRQPVKRSGRLLSRWASRRAVFLASQGLALHRIR